MAKTTSEVKDRWNRKHYDAVTFRIPKGEKERIQAAAVEAGESLNAFICNAVRSRIEGMGGLTSLP